VKNMKTKLAILVAICSLVLYYANAQTNLEIVVSSQDGLKEPVGIAADPDSNYYITDSAHNRVLKLTSGTLSIFAGSYYSTPGTNDGKGFNANFFVPAGIVFARGGLVVADAGNNRIRFIDLNGNVSTLAGSSQGFADGTNALFNYPFGLAVDNAGNIYIADLKNDAIRKLDTLGNVTTVVSNGLYRPSAVAVGDSGELYIADTGNNAIKKFENNTLTLIAGSNSQFEYGWEDSILGESALFNQPRGLVWVGGKTGLLVTDNGNENTAGGVVRKVYYNSNLGDYSVETISMTIGSGMKSPVGITKDIDGNILIACMGDNTVRRIPTTQVPLPPCSDPVIGVVVSTNILNVTYYYLVPITNATFDNDVILAISKEVGTIVNYEYAATTRLDEVPDPSATSGNRAPDFANGQTTQPIPLLTPAEFRPDITIKAIATATGRKPSSIVAASIRFQVASPTIIGNDPTAVMITNITAGSEIWYTVDGSDPAPNSGTSVRYDYNSPVINIINGTNDVTLKVRAFKNNYHPSSITSRVFHYTDAQISLIGATRDIKAGVGAFALIPIEVKMASTKELRSLQFRVEIAPDGSAPMVSPNLFRMLSFSTNEFIDINGPAVAGEIATFSYSVYTNKDGSVGSAVTYIGTNANMYVQGEAVVGIVGVRIPAQATEGQTYTIRVLQPSGTSDGNKLSVYLKPFDNKKLIITNISYVVGDVSNARWFNAGDFGDKDLQNNDVNAAFYASLGIRVPYVFSDIFDAMDAYPVDTLGNVGGDGQIRYLDWQITLSRSLRLSTNNWVRRWNSGNRIAEVGSLTSQPLKPATITSINPGVVWNTQAKMIVSDVENAIPGKVVKVPVTISVKPGYSVKGLQFRGVLEAGANAPSTINDLQFVSAPGIANASRIEKFDNFDIGVAWNLNSISTLQNEILLGFISFTVPSNAVAGQYYTVRLAKSDGAADINTQYEFESFPGRVWIQTSALLPGEVFSDEWKLRFVGVLKDIDPAADFDGDGISNLQEYLNGTNPVELRLQRLKSAQELINQNKFSLRWFGVFGKKYNIQASDSLTNWVDIGNVTGNGSIQEFLDALTNSQGTRFYRVIEVQQQ